MIHIDLPVCQIDRIFLCGLGRPDLCGGVTAVARGLERWRERIDLMKLMRYAMQMRNRTAARRLGYLLEELGMATEETQAWLGLAVFEYYGRLEPERPWAGRFGRPTPASGSSSSRHTPATSTCPACSTSTASRVSSWRRGCWPRTERWMHDDHSPSPPRRSDSDRPGWLRPPACPGPP